MEEAGREGNEGALWRPRVSSWVPSLRQEMGLGVLHTPRSASFKLGEGDALNTCFTASLPHTGILGATVCLRFRGEEVLPDKDSIYRVSWLAPPSLYNSETRMVQLIFSKAPAIGEVIEVTYAWRPHPLFGCQVLVVPAGETEPVPIPIEYLSEALGTTLRD